MPTMIFGPLLRASARLAGAFVLLVLLGVGALQAAPQVLNQARPIDRLGNASPTRLPSPPGTEAHWLQLRFERRGGEREAAALWLPSPCGVQSVHMNGVGLLHDEGGLACGRPQLLAVP